MGGEEGEAVGGLAPLAGLLGESTVIVGVGNDLCGDDGAGPAVARALRGTVPWCVYDAQTAPESFLGKIIAHQPASVIVVDALGFGAPPGSVRVVEAGDVDGQGPSTHGPAPLAFLEALVMMYPCRCAVVGIQPGCVVPGREMQPAVREAVERVVAAFRQLAP
ncbi:MAG TPA: hydrogenase maturation protease [Phycisphaerae bacterium]|nr:hydrogenase maturation protease [Phycisphaerae bacterium]